MKVIKETLDNYIDKATTVLTNVEAGAIKDEEVFDERAEKVAKEISKPLDKDGTIDGAPKAIKPEEAIVPEPIKEALDATNTSESLNEDINEDNAGRVIHDVIRNMYGIDVEVATYKDDEESNCVIAQFIISKEENSKMKYDDLKEEIYQRMKDINISCKQFSSPNLVEKGTEYKLKLFIIKEAKDKIRNKHKRKHSRKKTRKVGQHADTFVNTSENLKECRGIRVTHVNKTKPSTTNNQEITSEPVKEKVLYDSYDEGLDTAFMHAYTN